MQSNQNFPVLETDRLILRELDASDIDDLFEIFSSEEVMKYYGMFPFENRDDLYKVIESFSNGFKEECVIRWGIQAKSDGKIIGTCGFHNWNKKHFRAEVGYELSKAYWQKGYMTEAIKKIVHYGFAHMNLNRIEAIVYPENLASQNTLIRLGFREEGLLRDYMYFRDQLTNVLMFSLLKKEYKD